MNNPNEQRKKLAYSNTHRVVFWLVFGTAGLAADTWYWTIFGAFCVFVGGFAWGLDVQLKKMEEENKCL